jgi:predicted TIM-barrel fold metal-dependent hydrolase
MKMIDVDQHYYEADDCCTRHCPAELRERVPHPVMTQTGEREWRIGDRHIAFERWLRDITSAPGSMHRRFDQIEHGGDPDGGRREVIDTRVDEFRDRERRITLLDAWGIDAAVLLPSAVLGFDAELTHDVPAAVATAHAFNRWVEDDWGYSYRNRVFALPFVSLLDVDAAVSEVERVLALGARMVMVRTGPVAGRSPAEPSFDPFWARVQEAGVPVALHISASGYESAMSAMWGEDPAASHRTFTGFQWYAAFATRPITDTLAAMVFHNLFGRFPRLRIVSIENGSLWVAPLLRDLDVAYRFVAGRSDAGTWKGGKIADRPSAILSHHLTVAPYLSPGFDAPLAELVESIGVDHVAFGSDWPHGEGRASPLEYLPEIKTLDNAGQRAVLHENGAALLGV